MIEINPIQHFLDQQGLLILDGGLATELEARGHDLHDDLWSARLLLAEPDAIRQLHADYLAAGADCLITASYQATIAGFRQRGLNRAEAEALLQRSVSLALAARETFWAVEANRPGRSRPLVAASIGPYGAYLADGSEYNGRYGLDTAALVSFHQERWHLLSQSGADLLACETIPSAIEAQALAQLLAQTASVYAWFSFSCRDGRHINDGTPLADCVALLNRYDRVAAVGVNCTAPQHISSLIAQIRQVSVKPIVVYPNSGETYDAANGRWSGEANPADFAAAGEQWWAAGATLIGGCCRTGPDHIRQIRKRLKRAPLNRPIS
jgi:homocysteine S-methyltransferase